MQGWVQDPRPRESSGGPLTTRSRYRWLAAVAVALTTVGVALPVVCGDVLVVVHAVGALGELVIALA
jgi:hypothetical protein